LKAAPTKRVEVCGQPRAFGAIIIKVVTMRLSFRRVIQATLARKADDRKRLIADFGALWHPMALPSVSAATTGGA
jgi:hypothetical protein